MSDPELKGTLRVRIMGPASMLKLKKVNVLYVPEQCFTGPGVQTCIEVLFMETDPTRPMVKAVVSYNGEAFNGVSGVTRLMVRFDVGRKPGITDYSVESSRPLWFDTALDYLPDRIINVLNKYGYDGKVYYVDLSGYNLSWMAGEMKIEHD